MSAAAEPYPTTLALEDAETTRLFEAYADRMLAYCTRRLRSRSDAEDAVQTIFLYAMRALRRGVEPECESAWLHTIAKNVCNWHQRTVGRRPVASDFEIESLACAQTDEDVELLSGLREALESLPPQQQHALVLREWHGVPPREIAVELGLTAPQTHALLTRARRSLAQALTAPKRAALGLGGLAFAFRARLEALVGGVAVKTAAVVSIVAVGSAGVAGATSEDSAPKVGAGPEAPIVQTGGSGSAGGPSGPVARRSVPTKLETPAARPSAGRARDVPATAPGAGAVPGVAGSESAPSSAPGAGAADTGAPLDLPTNAVPALELPQVKVPPVKVPPVDVPPVTVPPVKVPQVNVGPVSTPPVNVEPPPVDLPPVELPPVQLPPVEVPPIPLPTLPPLGLPR